MTKFIIGGGISSLIFKYYNPSFVIVSPEIGGDFLNGIQSVSWIHRTSETQKLLKDLKLIIDPYRIKIGYYYNELIHDSCPNEYKIKIAQRKMSDIHSKDLFPIDKIPSLILSSNSNVLNILRINFNYIFDLLKKNLDFISDKVTRITDKYFETEKGQKYEYQTLVSTIPAPVFWKLYNQPKNFKYLPVTFVETWEKPLVYDNQYQMIYFSEDYLFVRISRKESAIYSYEFTHNINNIKEYLPNVQIHKLTIRDIGRIIPQENEPPTSKIMFLGRLAQWEYSSKIQDVIKKSIEYSNHNN